MALLHSIASRPIALLILLSLIALASPLRAEERGQGVAAEITSATVATTTFKPGDSIIIGFTTSGTFDGGNVFSAQISGLNGSFAQARVIGVLEATSDGLIAGKLPCELNPGTGYRVRVIASAPAATSPDNGADLTILPHAVITTSPAGTVTICAGDSVLITAESGYRAYRWNTGDSTRAFYARAAGIYTLTATDSNDCGLVARVTVKVNTVPKPVIRRIADSISLIEQFGSYASFQWLGAIQPAGPYEPVPGAIKPTFYPQPQDAGYYRLRVTDTNGCTALSDSALYISLGIAWIPASEAGVKIYPQPARDRVMIEADLDRATDVTIAVVDMAGRELLRRAPERASGHFRREISVETLPAGTYLLRIELGSRHLVEKLVKEH